MKNKIFFCLIFSLVFGVVSTPSAQPLFQGVNCGSNSDYTSPTGDLYVADRQYTYQNGFGYLEVSSETFGPNRDTYATEDMDTLYFFRREGDFSYQFDVPAGHYAVNLYFSEKLHHGTGFRSFSIFIEGAGVAQDIDIFELVGSNYAVPLRYLTECLDGQINVELTAALDSPTLSAVSVRAVTPDSQAPLPTQNLIAIGGYDMNILYWDYCVAPDLAGYRVYGREAGGEWISLTAAINPLYRYFDYDAEVGVESEYKITVEDLWGNESNPSNIMTATAVSPESADIPRYIIDITPENLYQLNINITSNNYVQADLTLEGEFLEESWIRYRGGSSRPVYKKNYKLKLPTGETHNHRDRFNLQSDYNYDSMLPSKIAYQTYDLLDILNPFTQSIYLERNSEYIGVYLDIEEVNNHFLERNGLSTGGNLYKCVDGLVPLSSLQLYQSYYQKRNNPNSDWSDIIDFIQWLNDSSPSQFHEEVGERCDLDGCIDMYMVQIATAEDDFAYQGYFMYNNTVDGKWYFTAWDHDMTFDPAHSHYYIDFGSQAHPIYTEWGPKWNKLYDKFLNDELYRYAYCKKLERFLYNEFTVHEVTDLITNSHQEIYDYGLRDVYKKGRERPDLFIHGPESHIQFIRERVPFLLAEIESFISNPELAPHFRLNEIQSDNRSTIADEAGDFDSWTEIVNLAPVELDMEGFILHHGNDSWVLPPEAVIDDYGFLLIWLDGETGEGPLHANFALSTGGGSIWLEERHGSMSDSVGYPVLGADQVWARNVDGAGYWVGDLEPSPWSTNIPLPTPSPLVVNEFLALNDNWNPDPAGEYDDWAEIYNPTGDTIFVGGVYFTDDLARPMKWALPDTVISPGSFLLIWCDDDPEQGVMHSTFKLSGNGEQIGLYDRDGITPIDTFTFGQQQSDISYGRYPDGSAAWMNLYIPTPGEPNNPMGVGDIAGNPIPREYSLEPNFPNPFNPETIIRFGLPRNSQVRLIIFDLLGRQTAELVDGKLSAGYHSVSFDGSGLASGIYFCRLEAGDFLSTRKMLLLK